MENKLSEARVEAVRFIHPSNGEGVVWRLELMARGWLLQVFADMCGVR